MRPVLLTILLLEGFITISVEIITIRQLLPFFGGSVVITSVIIGFFLLFLAVGYWRGGSHRQHIFQQLSRNFTLSLIWIGVGLSYSFIGLYYYFSTFFLRLPFLLNLSLYLLFVLAPIVYWLGQTVPLTTNLFSKEHGIGRISGSALFLSTIGSFLGAILTSLLLFQSLGVAWTIVINCLFLFGLVIYIRPFFAGAWWPVLALLILLIYIFLLNVNIEKKQFALTNNYANYQVRERPDFSKILMINQSSSSRISPTKEAFPYIEFIRDVLFKSLNLRHKAILVIGAGGFTLGAKGTHENAITYVDIDASLKDLAETQFLNEPIQGQFVGEDARRFLKSRTKHYDVILSDVYSHFATIPPSLLTVEYFAALKAHLTEKGLLMVNVIQDPLFADSFAKRVFNTIHTIFPYCAVVPLDWKGAFANVIYICPNTKEDNGVYRDDLTTATMDFFKSQQRIEG